MTEWLRTVGPGVGNHLWQSTAFGMAAWAVTLLLRKNQARVRYGVWLAASLKFLIPFSLLIGLGGMLPRPQHTVVTMPVYSAVDEVGMPFSAVEGVPIAAVDPTHAAMKPRHEWGARRSLPLMLGVVWVCGVVVVLARWLGGWLRVTRTLRRAVQVGGGREAAILRRVEERMGGGGGPPLLPAVPLLLSRELMEPGMFGIWRPVLIWPERLEDEHIEAVMIHEIVHATRRDNLTAALHMIVEAAFWFHPLVWWMERRMVEERERACDEAVVEMGSRPGVYAESLLKACRFCVESPLVCVAGITGADLASRVRAIMTLRVQRMGWGMKIALGLFALAAIGAPIVLGQAKAAQRMMLAAVEVAPKPVRAWAAAHAMILEEQTLSTGLIPEVQGDAAATNPPKQSLDGAPVAGGKPFKFDVVSIRPADPEPSGRKRLIGFRFTDDGFETTNQSLMMTLLFQYQPEFQLDSNRIVGGPDWVRTLRWDIRAKVADSDIAEWGKLSHDSSEQAKERRRATVEVMLAERFKLRTHIETAEGTVYRLVVAKGGPKLKTSTSDVPPQMKWGMGGMGHLSVERAEIAAMVPFFAQELGHPVIDKTGITGKYDVTLDWTPTQAAAGAPNGDAGQASTPGDVSAPSLFTAVQEQLGLKLEAQKGPVEHLVIDAAEKPSVDGVEVPDANMKPIALEQERSQPNETTTFDFDVVSVHRDKSNLKPASNVPLGPGGVSRPSGGILNATNFNLPSYIEFAYKLTDYQEAALKATLPDWALYDRFTIEARTENQNVTKDELRLMMQSLLAERFKLTIHYEDRRVPVLALVTIKPGSTGPKLRKHPADSSCPGFSPHATDVHGTPVPDPPETVAQGFPTFCGGILGVPASAQDRYSFGARNVPMSFIATSFDSWGHLDRPVVDETALGGPYDFVLEFTPEPPPKYATIDSGGPTFQEALRKQLGLRLEAKTGSIKFLVLDHVERPSEN